MKIAAHNCFKCQLFKVVLHSLEILNVDFENCVYASFDQMKMKFPFQGRFLRKLN